MSTHPIAPGARWVDPAVLARVRNLEFVARSVVDGVINGLHRSPFFGASVDFAEHRGYVPGDDIRRVDWKVFARTDRYFVKEFEADSNANFSVLLDVSRSMAFGERLSKLDYARTLAACLAYLVHMQRDRVGLALFDEAIVEFIPPSAKHFDLVLHALDRARAERPGHIESPLKKLAEHFGRRGIVVVISDFYAEPEDVFRAIGPIRFRGNDVILFHVLDPAEVDFSFTDPASFEDLETGDQLPIVPEALGDRYRALVQAHLAELASRATAQGVDYMLLNTAMPLDHALFRYLSIRDRLTRTR
ncbi:MAG TPA: DUF58 domain-containing protein [Vicinamibacterales bacterium]|nr:DUF58 domain-containing protein [Vicinamibacterales bacterium]